MQSKLIVSAIVSGASALGLGWLYMARFEARISGGGQISVLTLAKEVKAGTALTPDMIGVRNVPSAYVDDRAVLARDQEKVVGINVVIPLKPQQTLQWTDLATRTDARSVSDLLAPGKRAMTIRAKATDNAGNGLVQPGDYVDVLAIVDGKGDRTSGLILQRVLVIAVGADTEQVQGGEANGKKRRDDRLLTLSLDVDETQLLSLAAEQGRLAVALRNPDDQRVFDDMPDLGASQLVAARDKVQARKRTGARLTPETPVKLTEAR